MDDDAAKSDVVRIREALASLIDLSGLSRREIERRLAQEGRGVDVSRLLTGRLDLKVHQMLDIINVIDVHPVEFFRLIFTEPERRSPLLNRVQTLFVPSRPPASSRDPGRAEREIEELRRRIDDLGRMVDHLKARQG